MGIRKKKTCNEIPVSRILAQIRLLEIVDNFIKLPDQRHYLFLY